MKSPLHVNGRFFWLSEELVHDNKLQFVLEPQVFKTITVGQELRVPGIIGYSTREIAVVALNDAMAKKDVKLRQDVVEINSCN